ncbi:MAG: GIY-YIG nuclease family protein [Pirellulales bacterium]|nr:GIY-YIG nuclease family protein [Pirellulales bacterium]
MYYVYVLQNASGRFYIGQTADLQRRVQQHNGQEKGTGKYTLKNGPWRLVWSEEHEDRVSAMRREKQIKAMKSARWIRENLLADF